MLKSTWRTFGFGFTISASVKKATPRQRQSNLLQVVTQWKSETSSNCGRALNSSQLNIFGFSTRPPISRRQSARAISGLIPRSRIGKPWVRCWPGGRRVRAGLAIAREVRALLILRAQRSLRSIKLGLGDATAVNLTAGNAALKRIKRYRGSCVGCKEAQRVHATRVPPQNYFDVFNNLMASRNSAARS